MKPGRLWMVAICLGIILVIVLGWYFWQTTHQKSTSATPAASGSLGLEVWTKDKKIFDNVTSSCTLKISDNLYRMYLMKDGQIFYADSKDASSFSLPAPTGITGDSGNIISNPAVLKIADNNWLMIYEQAPNLPKDAVKGPAKAAQRNLLAATSADGKSFQKAGTAIDSSQDDNYFASVPDLVLVKEGLIRMYFVSGGDKIASVTSANGVSWHREAGFRLEDSSVDPDVLVKTDADGTKHWVMYFATLEGAGNKIYKATSLDGLAWKKGEVMLRPDASSGVVVDPDVVQISEDKYRMFFGQSANGNVQMGGSGQLDLYAATANQDIFK